MTFTPNDKVIDKLSDIETTLRVGFLGMMFVIIVWVGWLVMEVQELQDLHSVTETVTVEEVG